MYRVRGEPNRCETECPSVPKPVSAHALAATVLYSSPLGPSRALKTFILQVRAESRPLWIQYESLLGKRRHGTVRRCFGAVAMAHLSNEVMRDNGSVPPPERSGLSAGGARQPGPARLLRPPRPPPLSRCCCCCCSWNP